MEGSVLWMDDIAIWKLLPYWWSYFSHNSEALCSPM